MFDSLRSRAESRPGRILPPLAWIALSFYLSHQPSLPYPGGFDAKFISTLGHVGVFGVLAVLIWWTLGLTSLSSGRRAMLAVLLTVAYGFMDEWHQSFVPGRTPDWRDIVADTVGATLAMLAVLWIERRVKRRREQRG